MDDKERLSFRTEAELAEQLRALARRRDRSLSATIRQALRAYLSDGVPEVQVQRTKPSK